MLSVVPILSGCPMTTTRNGRTYLATVARGEAISLQGDKSDVKLEIKQGCPKRAYLMEVRTDLLNFGSLIPANECFISPIVKVLAPAETNTSSYILRIPHCLDEDDDKTKVKVRMIHENRNPAVPPIEVPKGNAGALYYNIDARFIELHTTHFTKVVCTICQTPYHCTERINNLWFAKFITPEQTQMLSQNVEIRPYFGGILYSIADFRKDVEATVNLRYITSGSIKTSRQQFDPESGQINLSLTVEDSAWQPTLGLAKWNPTSRTFTEQKDLLDVIGSGNIHRCRAQPFEATIYSFGAEVVKLETFKAVSRTQLTLEVKETLEDRRTKTEHSSLELPVNFTRDAAAALKTCLQSDSHLDTVSGRVECVKPTTVSSTGCNMVQPLSEGCSKDKRKADEDTNGHDKTNKRRKISETDIERRIETMRFDELPSELHDREIARLALLFSPNTLETVALLYFGTSEAEIGHSRANNLQNSEGFNRELLHKFLNKGHTRKGLYRILLKAESEGILEDSNMLQMERLIFDPISRFRPLV